MSRPAPPSPPVSAPVDDPVPGLKALIDARILAAPDRWLGFEDFMALALYAPGLGYYAGGDRQFGLTQRDGSDFVTAPEMSPLFARALAVQLAQALEATGTTELWEFGAGTGALAAGLLEALGERLTRYTIVDLSGTLRARQQATVAARAPDHLGKLRWVNELPEAFEGVVVGNEVLDAMPVVLLHFDGGRWFERGVTLAGGTAGAPYAWADRPTDLRPPLDAPFVPGTVTELPRQGSAFIRTLAQRLTRGAAFFLDYGFPEHEFYLPQRHGGTLMCHRAHVADPDPLVAVGRKDITAHVDFSAVALAGQDAGLTVLGYASQGRFLLNCGLGALMATADLPQRAMAQRLVTEHEMGELFKVIGFVAGAPEFDAVGFTAGDRCHQL